MPVGSALRALGSVLLLPSGTFPAGLPFLFLFSRDGVVHGMPQWLPAFLPRLRPSRGGGEGGVRLWCGCLSVAHYMLSSCCADLTEMLAQPWQQQRQTAIFPASQLIQPVFFMLLSMSPFGRGKGGPLLMPLCIPLSLLTGVLARPWQQHHSSLSVDSSSLSPGCCSACHDLGGDPLTPFRMTPHFCAGLTGVPARPWQQQW